jgi:hypothetical protein
MTRRPLMPENNSHSKNEPEYTDIEQHEPKRAGIVVSVRLKPDEAQLLHVLSDRDGRSLSETLRIALHAFSKQPPRLATTPAETVSLTRGGVFKVGQSDLTLV